jgi:hypothetical protein
MKSLIRNVLLFVSGLIIVIVFQNCGQPGALSEAGSSLSKSDAPLVADVVGEMQNQQSDSVEHITPIRHREIIREDDVVYDNDLENVLQDHSCQNNPRKILICHYPPGNPAARHEICISRSALAAHMRHGDESSHQDHLGACSDE